MRVGRATGEGWLRLGDAAAELGVSLNTLRRWSDAGKLTVYRSPGGHRRYRRADVEALLRAESRGRGATTGRRAQPCPAASPSTTFVRLLLTLASVAAEGVGVDQCRISVADERRRRRAHGVQPKRRRTAGEQQESGPETPAPVAREVLRTGRRLVIGDLATTTLLEQAEAEALRRHGDVGSAGRAGVRGRPQPRRPRARRDHERRARSAAPTSPSRSSWRARRLASSPETRAGRRCRRAPSTSPATGRPPSRRPQPPCSPASTTASSPVAWRSSTT